MLAQHSRRTFVKAAAAAGLSYIIGGPQSMAQAPESSPAAAALLLINGRIATQDAQRPFASAVAIGGGRFLAVGTDQEVMQHRGPNTTVLDVGGRTVIPGLNDSHAHPIRGGLNYNLELRWDGVPSLAELSSRGPSQRTTKT